MENQNQMPNNMPQMDVNNPIPPQNNNNMDTNKGGMGGIIATIVIIALIILGGLYFWGKRIDTQKQIQNNSEETAAVAEAMKTINVSGDDSLDAIESDLQGTNTGSVNTNIDF